MYFLCRLWIFVFANSSSSLPQYQQQIDNQLNLGRERDLKLKQASTDSQSLQVYLTDKQFCQVFRNYLLIQESVKPLPQTKSGRRVTIWHTGRLLVLAAAAALNKVKSHSKLFYTYFYGENHHREGPVFYWHSTRKSVAIRKRKFF